eukprot:TRINITY_DN5476_c0_g3_i3.p1 TRINITY_DN5476_c0_g3~~TRINITY_DN5476_c0_g3_i3.p1  ORF type:complete len:148 (+),score=27.54 TRINITY_DN5476_c0_g3_i3:55-498(+)
MRKYLSTNNSEFAYYSCNWLPFSTKLVAVGQFEDGSNGVCSLYDISESSSSEGSLKRTLTLRTRSPLKCCTFDHSILPDRFLATGDFDGELAQWDLEEEGVTPVRTFKAHREIINSLDGTSDAASPFASTVCTAGREGWIFISSFTF